MWPALSITKPEPSAFWVCVWGRPKLKNGSEFVLITCVEVTCTTPGASWRKISLIVSARPRLAVSKEVGELPPRAGWIWRTVVVLLPTPSAVAPTSETTPPTTPAAPSAATGSTLSLVQRGQRTDENDRDLGR